MFTNLLVEIVAHKRQLLEGVIHLRLQTRSDETATTTHSAHHMRQRGSTNVRNALVEAQIQQQQRVGVAQRLGEGSSARIRNLLQCETSMWVFGCMRLRPDCRASADTAASDCFARCWPTPVIMKVVN